MLALSLLLFAQAAALPEVAGTPGELAALRYIDIVKGSGRVAEPGKKFKVHYTGWLRDGTKFDSSVDRNEPFEFVQGRRLVIAGWEAGFEGMRVGGKRRLFIPYQFAYGEKGRDPIPPKAELIFDLELLDVSDVPDVLPAADLLLPLSDLESKIMALARATPEDKLTWRPSAEARSFGEVFLHIALGNRLLLDIATEGLSKEALEKRIQDNAREEKGPLTRDRIVKLLEESFGAVRKSLEAARAGALAQDVQFFGRAATQRTVLTFLETHLAEHTGQAIAYARMNGIVPPWSGK